MMRQELYKLSTHAEAEVVRQILATPGVKVLKTKLPPADEATLSPRLPDGTAIISFVVPERPSPWRAPTTTRSGVSRKDPALLKWQATVQHHARLAMDGMPPYSWPVRVELAFRLVPARNGAVGDLSNLVKATEDSLQGIVITNDRLVCRLESERVLDQDDGATIRVYAFDPIGREP
jgi:Holliday junction resolvase RusA-like endonuclease